MFLHIIAKLCNMKPHILTIITGDTHIYLNHLEQIDLQLSRKPLPFPKFIINDIEDKDLCDITLDDFDLVGYLHHPAIKAEMAI